jgi:ribosome assembly protein YihI (activator of Der GTPase)
MDENDKQSFEAFFVKQTEQSDRRMDVLMDHFDHKMDLVVEGQQMLAERLDRMEFELKEEIGKVDRRITTLAADVAEHRADTEAHHGIYMVKESEE